MGCCGDREKFENPDNEQKWDYINLSDFRSTSCATPLSYGILYIFLIISVAVYAVDLFTCANLLLFDKWSGQVKPVLPFEISRWIFTGCIILSWVLLAFRWWRAIRAMRSGVVAASYLDPLAVRVQSVRMGPNGRGWRRFLVFAALTKGRKGTEYVALFTYFSFEAWLRICFAEGPRQVVNALTLYSVMQADLVPAGQHAATKGHTPVIQFFVNVQILANKEKEQAAILFGMLFTLVIWVFSALSLLMALIFYITFLWHHIRDGSLSRYCRRKIDSRLHKIVMVKVDKALAKAIQPRTKEEAEIAKAGVLQSDFKRQPTLPVLDPGQGPPNAPLSRQTTQTDLSFTDSRLPTETISNSTAALNREPQIPDLFSNSVRPLPPSRSPTQDSGRSYASFADDAPLISSAAPLGYDAPGSSAPRMRAGSERAPNSFMRPSRDSPGAPHGSQRSYGQPHRQYDSTERRLVTTPGPPQQQQIRRQTPQIKPIDPRVRTPGPPGFGSGRGPIQDYEMQSQYSRPRINKSPPTQNGYVAYNPNLQTSRHDDVPFAYPMPMSSIHIARNLVQPPGPPPINYFGTNQGPQRSGTAPLPAASYDGARVDAYGGSWHQSRGEPNAHRPATAGPGSGRYMPPRF